jgi:hypothetical protein
MPYPFARLAQKLFPARSTTLLQAQQAELLQQFEQDLRPRSFMESYQVFYYLAIALALLAQIASAYSSYQYVSDLIQLKMKASEGVHYLTLLVLALIEVIKFYLFKITCQKYFGLPREPQVVLLFLTLTISGLSAYASIVGGGHYGIDGSKVVQTENRYADLIRQKQTEIQNLQNRDDYKQIIWTGRGQTTKTLNPAGLALIQKREQELSDLQTQQAQTLQTIQKSNQVNQQRYQWVFGGFEATFLLCSIFVWYYKRTAILDQRVQMLLQNEASNQENPLNELQSTLQQFALTLKEVLEGSKTPKNPHQATLNLNNEHSKELNIETEKTAIPTLKPLISPLKSKDVNPTKSDKTANKLPKPTLIAIAPFKAPALVKENTLSNQQTEALKQLQNQQVALEATLKQKDMELQTLQSALQQKFEATLKQASLKNAKYLQKYQALIELIFDMEYRQFNDAEIREQVMQNFKVSEGTYYNIKRILNNPTN